MKAPTQEQPRRKHGLPAKDTELETKTSEVGALVAQLQSQINRAIAVMTPLQGDEISGHGCAMGGSINDLLAHNAEHERMHYGQIADRRYSLGLLQRTPRQRFLAEWYRERAALIALLLDLPDSALDAPTGDGETTIRQIVEHVLYWDRDSVEYTAENGSEGQGLGASDTR